MDPPAPKLNQIEESEPRENEPHFSAVPQGVQGRQMLVQNVVGKLNVEVYFWGIFPSTHQAINFAEQEYHFVPSILLENCM
jgi:hypothetical protein